LRNSKLNKENIDSNFKNIINSFSNRVTQIQDEVNKIKEKQEVVAQPLIEYCDMLTKEYAHLNEQTTNTKESIQHLFQGLHTSFPGAMNKEVSSNITNKPFINNRR